MKKMNLKSLAVLGLTSGMALTAQGAFADTNSTNGTMLAAGCAHCGGFGASTKKANKQNDNDDIKSDDDGQIADNARLGQTPVQPIAPAPQTNMNNPSNNPNLNNQNRYNNSNNSYPNRYNNTQPNQNGLRNNNEPGSQRRSSVGPQ